MDKMIPYDAILFPAGERAPHLVPLMMSNAPFPPPGQSGSQHTPPAMTKVPHPGMYMGFIASEVGSQAWQSHVIERLNGMNKKFVNPYIIFYPVLSRDGIPFPINKCLKEIQGPNYHKNLAWRGDLVIAKYCDEQLSVLIDAIMADFPILKNYLSTHYQPVVAIPPPPP
ncbi:hypothetical protein BDM02DRAFT_3157603 [Thelephora ganbajun]|uniref:Uncharacterized protein n=1 Tax=Thelephora ganbajun TaxID=370292 RepID=A0ACB6YX83_THEGA|nr:hypothetical protein BDM02DRAFT_3157603 [Thelephora ganbajun]